MNNQILIVFCLTFVIHLISTLAYSVRLVGTRTGRIAISFSLFNLLALVSRTANMLQAPLLAKYIEQNIQAGTSTNLITDFRWLLISATCATIVGGILIPTFQKTMSKAVKGFSLYRSLPRLLLHGVSKAGLHHIRTSLTVPATRNLSGVKRAKQLPWRVIGFHTFAESLITVGVLASLYAGTLNPELRMTASNLSALVNGGAVILLLIFIDPYFSMLTDDVMQGQVSQPFFRRCVIMLVISRLIATILAQVWLLPAAYLIIKIAEIL